MTMAERIDKWSKDHDGMVPKEVAIESAELNRLNSISVSSMADEEFGIHQDKISDCYWRRRQAWERALDGQE